MRIVNVFVDVEATDDTPFSGEMTEFGAVTLDGASFHGVLVESVPSELNPAKPVIVPNARREDAQWVMIGFDAWLAGLGGRPVFVSDNNGYDYMWIAYYFDKYLGRNPFGHSSRRIGDLAAGFSGNWKNTSQWKKWRDTPHTHNPVDDARGNAEAFVKILQENAQEY